MDYNKLNSITKYPEILTYHKMGERGRLKSELSTILDPNKLYHVSEKIDGTNTRMIFIVKDECLDYFIGSREELLTAYGDRIYNPQLDIVDNLLGISQSINNEMFLRIENNSKEFSDGVYTIYSELYGGKLPATKQYTTSKEYASRVFDIAYLTLDKFNELSELPRNKIANWRQNGGQTFFTTDQRCSVCNILNLDLVPFQENIYGKELPVDIQETYDFMFAYRKSRAGIDFKDGRSEGVVIRSDDRKQIVKLRFEDYERTLGIKRK